MVYGDDSAELSNFKRVIRDESKKAGTGSKQEPRQIIGYINPGGMHLH